MALDPDQYRLSDADHLGIFEGEIKPAYLGETISATEPVAIIFGGQPGAGKSAALDAALSELADRGNPVQIFGDDLRNFHPAFARLMREDDKTAAFYTDRDTGRWVEMLIEQAKAQRADVVIEGTMRDHTKVAATMQSLRASGYQIDARALAVNPRLSEQGILQRYEGQKHDRGAARMTTAQAHQAALDGMLITLDAIEHDKLADRVTIVRRGGSVIYFNEIRNGEWLREPRARAAVEAERNRPMTLQELTDYARGSDKLATLISRAERQASLQEIKRLEELRRQADTELVARVQWQAGESLRQPTPTVPAPSRPSPVPVGIRSTYPDYLLSVQRTLQVASRIDSYNAQLHIERHELSDDDFHARLDAGAAARSTLDAEIASLLEEFVETGDPRCLADATLSLERHACWLDDASTALRSGRKFAL